MTVHEGGWTWIVESARVVRQGKGRTLVFHAVSGGWETRDEDEHGFVPAGLPVAVALAHARLLAEGK